MIDQKSNDVVLEYLNTKISGQLEAKKALITLFNRSYIRYYQRFIKVTPEEQCIKNKNVLLIGNSGCGKTYLINTLCAYYKAPVVKLSATDLTPAGARSGTNPGDIEYKIRQLAKCRYDYRGEDDNIHSVDGEIAKTIVYIDEIDKLGDPYSNENWQRDVQASLLKLIENTSGLNDISFIFSGAFTGLKEENNKTIGFHNKDTINNENTGLEQAVINYGMLPELVGRIHRIVKMDKYTEKEYRTILDTHILPNKLNELLAFGHHELVITEEQKLDIIKIAMNSNQGVRMLIKEVDKLIEELEYNSKYSYMGY